MPERLTSHVGENVTLTFAQANGDSGRVAALHRDDAGNHSIFERQ